MSRGESLLPGRVVVWDVGKTLAKLSLCDEYGYPILQRTRANARREDGGYRVLDVEGIEAWAEATLREFASAGPIHALVPVGHGAAAALLRDGALARPVSDYEDAIPDDLHSEYRARRTAFGESGSPALPDGLNLGAQLYRQQRDFPALFDDASFQILPWPQFWAWQLSNVAASEVSSLGCHSDLWNPHAQHASTLAAANGWAERLAPLRRADEVLGTLSPAWQSRTGLPANMAVYCGVHDSNAALHAARGFAEIGDADATVLSTGTWFVAMRPVDRAQLSALSLSEARDCLINVDVAGRPVPSARFMGGREIELLGSRIDAADDQAALLAALPSVLARGAMLLPSQIAGVGPYPQARAQWINEPDGVVRAAAIAVYAALMSDVLLEQIGTRERLLIEGRFAGSLVFTSVLATLRPDLRIFVSGGHDGVQYGALRLIEPKLRPPQPLRRVTPLDLDLAGYKACWRALADAATATP